MRRALLKYLLSLCIFLLSGHSLLSAAASPNLIRALSINHSAQSASAISGEAPTDLAPVIVTVSSGCEKENYDLKTLIVCNDNDDDDEVSSSKKHSGSSPYSALFAQSPGHLFSNGKKMSAFCKTFSQTPFDRYLLFQIFRI